MSRNFLHFEMVALANDLVDQISMQRFTVFLLTPLNLCFFILGFEVSLAFVPLLRAFLNLPLFKQWIIRAMEIAPDHVHLLVEHDPKTPINSIVKAFKGRSSRLLRKEFPHLLKLPTLWTHSYFYDTTGKVTTAKITEYINDPHHS